MIKLLSKHQKLVLAVVCLAAFGGIFLLSHQAHSADFTKRIFGSLNPVIRKLAHFSEFAFATIAAFAALRCYVPKQHWLKAAVIACVICVGYACLDEYHQSFVPGRTPSVKDVLIDSGGVACAFGAICLHRLARKK